MEKKPKAKNTGNQVVEAPEKMQPNSSSSRKKGGKVLKGKDLRVKG
ncbi:MAG: hypothetical protein ACYCWE_20725 [Eubacteriales bacterium]